MPESDSTLLRIAAGDPDAPRACIARHGALVWALARRESGGCHADAEDLVQEIFIDLWAHAGRFDPAVASEATFVALIARRRLIDRRRRLGRAAAGVPLPTSGRRGPPAGSTRRTARRGRGGPPGPGRPRRRPAPGAPPGGRRRPDLRPDRPPDRDAPGDRQDPRPPRPDPPPRTALGPPAGAITAPSPRTEGAPR